MSSLNYAFEKINIIKHKKYKQSLLLGINTYPKSNLIFSIEEVFKLNRTLINNGFNNKILIEKEVTKENVIYYLNSISSKSDIFLFFFSGHGCLINNELYLKLFYDKMYNSNRNILSFSELQENIKSSYSIAFLSCCDAYCAEHLNVRFNVIIRNCERELIESNNNLNNLLVYYS